MSNWFDLAQRENEAKDEELKQSDSVSTASNSTQQEESKDEDMVKKGSTPAASNHTHPEENAMDKD